eukprot:3192823-Amphidinium_carterae.1
MLQAHILFFLEPNCRHAHVKELAYAGGLLFGLLLSKGAHDDNAGMAVHWNIICALKNRLHMLI